MKNTKLILAIILIMTFSLVSLPIVLHAEETEKHNYKPKEGYVPDEETAIKIAVAVWTPIYGKEEIESEKPYKATLKDGIWYVIGSLPKGWKGGVAEAEISKDDGCIIRISHGE
ncbi:MAG: NTF2 fold immunity protein [Candidatus Omnitrophota bacterium]|nr:NTF2 fold immunity protein [Candidatus Omnitrophota bacterium]